MSAVVALRILLLAAEALAASSLLPVLAWAVAMAFRKRANMRHLIWLSALTGLLVLPVLASVLPAHLVFKHVVTVEPASVPAHAALPHETPSQSPHINPVTILSGLLAIWGLGVAVLALQSLVAWLGLHRLRARSCSHQPAVLNVLPPGLSGGRVWELRLSSDCAGPMTWGLFRTTVFLPWDAIRWPAERLQTVLRHELAHVRRRDCWSQALGMLVRALYWPNPLVWVAVKALRREAEIAADDAVIASGVRPSDYAEALLKLARDRRDHRLALAMAAPSALSDRVTSVLSPTPLRTGVTVMDVLKVALIGAAATAALAFARPGIAEIVQTAPPSAVAELQAPATHPAAPARAASTTPPARLAHKAVGVKDPLHPMTDADLVEMNRALAKIGPEIEQAMKDAHIEETIALQITAHQEMDRAELAKHMAEIGPRMQKAMADARIQERVAERMADIQPRIDAAIAKAHAVADRARQDAEKGRQAP